MPTDCSDRRVRPRPSRLAAVLTAGLVTLNLAACGAQAPSATSKPPTASAATPANTSPAAGEIRIGVLMPLSGKASAAGQAAINGWKLWWNAHGNAVDGHKIDSIILDTASSPNTALTKARLAVQSDHVQMMVGPALAPSAIAVAHYLEPLKIPFFSPIATSDTLTQQQASPYFLRIAGWTSSQTTHPAGVWAYRQGYRTAVTLANNYAFGFQSTGGFTQTFTQAGGRVLKHIWVPLGNTTDFVPYITQIQQAHPDVLFVLLTSQDAARFLQQWSSMGLLHKIPMIGQENMTDQANGLAYLKPESIALGLITFSHFAEGRNDPATQQFDAAYEQAYKKIPSYNAAALYVAGEWLDKALGEVHGNVGDKSAFLKAVRGVTLSDSAFGPMRLDKYGNPIENVYVCKVEPTPPSQRKYGPLWNVPIKTYKNVSQFWTYPPEQYLKQRPYSSTYQGPTNS